MKGRRNISISEKVEAIGEDRAHFKKMSFSEYLEDLILKDNAGASEGEKTGFSQFLLRLDGLEQFVARVADKLEASGQADLEKAKKLVKYPKGKARKGTNQ